LQIEWEYRFALADIYQRCFVTIDGTDFKINEPSPFDPGYYSHKLKHAGLRYEVGICMKTGWIVWINGPFMCGAWNDLRIARDSLHGYLLPGEQYVADGGYRNPYARTPNGLNNDEQRMYALARARHETVNWRFKVFKCMQDEWRHSHVKHGQAFRAVAIITQMAIAEGGLTFGVEYDEARF